MQKHIIRAEKQKLSEFKTQFSDLVVEEKERLKAQVNRDIRSARFNNYLPSHVAVGSRKKQEGSLVVMKQRPMLSPGLLLFCVMKTRAFIADSFFAWIVKTRQR